MSDSDKKLVRRSILLMTISMSVLAGVACGIFWAVGAWFISLLMLWPLSYLAVGYDRAMNDDEWLEAMYKKFEGGYR